MISQKDREILRALAAHKLELAHSARNAEILAMWQSQAEGRRDTPTVRLLFSNFTNEVIDARMQCEGEDARKLERRLLSPMVGRDLFEDDTPVTDRFDVRPIVKGFPFGTRPKQTKAKSSIGYHIEPLTEDIEADVALFENGGFSVDTTATEAVCAMADEVFGDILPSRIMQPSLTGAITNPLVRMIGMENYYMSMYDAPEVLHQIMEMATTVYERYFDELEQKGLLSPTNGCTPVAQESFAFTNELPAEGPITSTKQCWGFLESQETTAASPDMFGEFVYPYYDRLVKRFGLLSYGCCERVDNLWEDYLSKWSSLRKLSVSPFNDERKIGDFLRGTRVVYYSKPRAEYVTNPGPLDEEALRRYFRGVAEAASGCLFEVAQREVGTIFGDFERGKRYVQIAREVIAEHWKP